MNLASWIVALIVTSTAEAPGDPVLLDFQATWCGPCRQMAPVVDKLIERGYPVKKVDVDRSPDLSERYKVRAVPTFIVVDARGKELARTQGVVEPADLARFYNKAKLKAAESSPVEEAQERASVEDPSTDEGQAPGPAALVNPRPWETVVRIKMHFPDGMWGFGSGTIIYSSSEESIILTCAHIFRVKDRDTPSPKNFRVPISVDLFGGQLVQQKPATLACSEKDIPGEAIDYDFTHDVGLIRIRPGRRLPASRVVPTTWQPKKGMSMTTVGCSHGQDATAWSTTILDARVGMSNTSTQKSFATIKCAYQPKEGRSGGGLYTSDGYVAGVCDFADPNEKVGLYAVPDAIHKLLDRNQLMALYKAPTSGSDVMLASNRVKPKPSTGTRLRGQSPEEGLNPEDVTLPPPSMVGIKNPPGDPNARWSRNNRQDAPARNTRRPEPADVATADPVDTGVRPGIAQPVDLAGDPGPDARAMEDIDEPTPLPAIKRSSTSNPSTSKWKPARNPLPDLSGSRPGGR